MGKIGNWFFEKFLTLLLSGGSMILNSRPVRTKLGEKITEAIQKEIGFESNISVTFGELKIESHYGWRDLNFKGNFVINAVDIKNLIQNNKGEQ